MILTQTDMLEAVGQSRQVQSKAPVIAARQLDFYFTSGSTPKQILFDVNLDIEPGEFVLLTGPSGSGKTTLLTLIGGLRTVTRGRLNVLGQQLNGIAPRSLVPLRRRIGFIFQTHNLLEFMSVRRNVEMAFELQPKVSPAEARERSEGILQGVGLGRHLDQHPSNLSVGQRQRVAIARALAAQPELILADEPTAALDSQAGRDVVQLLESLARDQGCPILMVTHDTGVLEFADRTISIEDGRVSE